MYLITAYFDEKTTSTLQRYIDRISAVTGNTYMKTHQVPPHLTILSVEARSGELLFPAFDDAVQQLHRGSAAIVSTGMLKTRVLYAAPVMNETLLSFSRIFSESFSGIPEVRISPFYQYMNWLPHITLGKTLSKEQMLAAQTVMMEQFQPVTGEIVSLGLAAVNPHRDLRTCELI